MSITRKIINKGDEVLLFIERIYVRSEEFK